jgi:hypothetical protein
MNQGSKISVIYLVGVSFSGSTLLSFLLGAHPRVENLGELQYFNSSWSSETHCTCGAENTACPFWKKYFNLNLKTYGRPSLKDVMKVWLKCILGRPVRRGFRQNSPDYQLLKRIKEDLSIDKCQTAYLLDSSKNIWRLQYLMECQGIDIKIVYIKRQAKHNIASFLKRNKSLFIGMLIYKMKHLLSERFLRINKDYPVYHMQYEKLCTEPDISMKGLGQYLDLDFSNYQQDLSRREFHAPAGNSGPIRQIREGTFKIRLNTSHYDNLNQRKKRIIRLFFK